MKYKLMGTNKSVWLEFDYDEVHSCENCFHASSYGSCKNDSIGGYTSQCKPDYTAWSPNLKLRKKKLAALKGSYLKRILKFIWIKFLKL